MHTLLFPAHDGHAGDNRELSVAALSELQSHISDDGDSEMDRRTTFMERDKEPRRMNDNISGACLCGRKTYKTFEIGSHKLILLCPLCSHLITKHTLQLRGHYADYLKAISKDELELVADAVP